MAKKPTRPSIYKVSISLYQADVDRLDEIKAYMLKQAGIRNLGDSEALRLACRCVSTGPNMLAAYESMRSEDGRRKK